MPPKAQELCKPLSGSAKKAPQSFQGDGQNHDNPITKKPNSEARFRAMQASAYGVPGVTKPYLLGEDLQVRTG